jgi:bifunctional DNA-binding transcriptional regulator/antitoxin component of YhaV-PrlF toxin-antitoxin module
MPRTEFIEWKKRMKLIKKIIQLEDGEVGIQFESEELEKLGWKEGDEFEWIPTKEGYKLMKMKTENKIKIKPELEDEAYDVAKFVQELGKVQDEYFDRLVKKAKEKNLIEGMNDEDIRDWLFDFVFNSGGEDGYPEFMFGEYLHNHGLKVE